MGPDLFLCEHFACRLTPAACVSRQEKARTTATANVVSALPFAACGRCEQGRQVRAELEQDGQLEAAQAKSEELRASRNRAFWQHKRTKPATTAGSTKSQQPAPAAVASTTPAEPAVTEEKTMEKTCVGCGVSKLRLSPAGRCRRCEAEAKSKTETVQAAGTQPETSAQLPVEPDEPAELSALSNAELASLIADTAKVLADARAEADRRLADLESLRAARESA